MSLPLLQTALLLPAQLLINQLLKLDPQSEYRLQPLNNKCLAIHCTSPEFTLFVTIRQQRFHFSAVSEITADATLAGSFRSLLGMLGKGSSIHNLHGTGVSLNGSTALVSGLLEAMLALDVDWEYQLSRLVGDLPTEAVSRTTSAARQTLHRTRERLHEDLHDYLTLESGLLPAPAEVDTFYQQIRQLILRTDRLQARLDQLTKPH